MRVIYLALKDLRQLVRDQQTFLFLLILPIVFTLLFGYAFGGDSTADPRLPVSVRDEDETALSQQLAAMLADSAVVRTETTDTAVSELEQQVSDENIAAAILIPAGFDAALRQNDPLPVTVIGGGQAGFTVESEVGTAVSRIASAVQAAQISTETARQQDLLSDAAGERQYFDQALDRALAAWESPPVSVTKTAATALADEAEAESGNYSVFAHSSPGMMAQFAIAGLIGAAGILVLEKQSRSLQRLLTTNLSRAEVLLGHYLAMFTMIFLQLATLILFGQLALKLPYLRQPLATLIMTIVTSLFAASLGLLIGALANKEEQVIVYALIPMFVLSGLGGAWVPLEFTPETFQQVAYLTPIAWVMDGYKDILVRGLGVTALGTAVAVLLGYATVLFAVAVWRFRFE